MGVQYYIARPEVFFAVQWTGDNFADVLAACPDADDNGDGTVTIDGANPLVPRRTATVGQWLSSSGGRGVSDDNPYATSQEVSSAGPLAYTVTDA